MSNPYIDTHVRKLSYEFNKFIESHAYLVNMYGKRTIIERHWPPTLKLGLENNGPIHTMDQNIVPVIARDRDGHRRMVVRVEGMRFIYNFSEGYIYERTEKEFVRKVRMFMTEWKQYLKDRYETLSHQSR